MISQYSGTWSSTSDEIGVTFVIWKPQILKTVNVHMDI